jgi:hypothetical protein
MHSENQMIYLRARTYDPVTAQFLSPDPLAAISGETYAYAAADPINLTDPMGLIAEGCDDDPPRCPHCAPPDKTAVDRPKPPKPNPPPTIGPTPWYNLPDSESEDLTFPENPWSAVWNDLKDYVGSRQFWEDLITKTEEDVWNDTFEKIKIEEAKREERKRMIKKYLDSQNSQ